MEVEVASKPAFSVIGIEGSGKAEEGPKWIKPSWDQAFGRRGEIMYLVESNKEAWDS